MIAKESDILFFYDAIDNNPNGDPFTNLPRYDVSTKRAAVSDVRIKRYIRDQINQQNKFLPKEEKEDLYIVPISIQDYIDVFGKEPKKMSGAAARTEILLEKYKKDPLIFSGKNPNIRALLLKCLDCRLFGGISTEKNQNIAITGPVQFNKLNYSLNKVELRPFQNTSVLQSDIATKKQGAIGTTHIISYALFQIYGHLTEAIAQDTNLTEEDFSKMIRALWNAINHTKTTSKMGQHSLLFLRIIYKEPFNIIYNIDDSIICKKENIARSFKDLELNFSIFKEIVNKKSDLIEEIQYKTVNPELDLIIKDTCTNIKYKAID